MNTKSFELFIKIAIDNINIIIPPTKSRIEIILLQPTLISTIINLRIIVTIPKLNPKIEHKNPIKRLRAITYQKI